MTRELRKLIDTCLLPAYQGLTPPDWIRRQVADGLGGVLLFAHNIAGDDQVAEATEALRAERPDLLVAIDEEGGDVTRLDAATGSTTPGNLALGYADDTTLTEQVACSIGVRLARAGVNFNLAPDADVNANPDNPIIGVRAFGADPARVARHTAAYVRGMQAAGVAACAKHFPGHGDTTVDSHLALPVLDVPLEYLRAVDLVPFAAAVQAGIRAMMTAHITFRALDDRPATLSPVVLGLLRHELGFDGVIVSDALEMRAIAGGVGIAAGAVQALAAGCDLLCVGADDHRETLDDIRAAVTGAVIAGELPEERLVEAAGRVAALAEWATLDSNRASHVPAYDAETLSGVGLAAARRGLLVEAALPLPAAPLVLELLPPPTIAAGPVGGDGVGSLLAAAEPDTVVVRVSEPVEGLDGLLNGHGHRPVVVVVRDAVRHPWQAVVLREVLAVRPDAITVATGLDSDRRYAGEQFVATHGASAVSAVAAVEALLGRRVR
jgi:beta-N-acetylhexosaminidase